MSRSNCHWPPADLVLWIPVSVGWVCFCLWTHLREAPETCHRPRGQPPQAQPSHSEHPHFLVAPDQTPTPKTWWVLVSGDFPVRVSVELWLGKPLSSPGKKAKPLTEWLERDQGRYAKRKSSVLPRVHPFGCLCQTWRMVTCSVLC